MMNTMDEKPTGYIRLFVNNCVTRENAVLRLQLVLPSSKRGPSFRLLDFEHNGKFSRVMIGLFGEIDEDELVDIFNSRRADFRLESIEIVPQEPNFLSGRSSSINEEDGYGEYFEGSCESADDERSLEERTTSLQIFAPFGDHNTDPDHDDRNIDTVYNRNIDSIYDEHSIDPVHDDYNIDPVHFDYNIDPVRDGYNTEPVHDDYNVDPVYDGCSTDPIRNECNTDLIGVAEYSHGRQDDDPSKSNAKIYWNTIYHKPFIDNDKQSYFAKQVELLKKQSEEAESSDVKVMSDLSNQQISRNRKPVDAMMEEKEKTGELNSGDGSGCRNYSISANASTVTESIADSIDNNSATKKESAADDEIIKPADELKTAGKISDDNLLIGRCSIPPMRISCENIVPNNKQIQTFRRKQYGEPPDILLSSLLTENSGLMLSSEIFNKTNAGTASLTASRTGVNQLSHSNLLNYPRNPILDPSPPWQQPLRTVRGRFNRETRKLEVQSKETNNIDQREILEAEIIKRKRRAEIFEEVQAEYRRKLRESPDAEAVLTERMEREIERFACGLPIYNVRKDIKNILCSKQKRVLVVVADTGSGKSTQIPQYLAFDGIIEVSQKILCTQPRKTAVHELAKRVAKETMINSSGMNNSICNDGMKLEINPKLKLKLNAKINFITEKHLLDCIQHDHHLSSVGCVMIDEVHERTVNTDMCLGMMKKVLRVRQDMKLVICSATMDPEPVLKYFDEFGAEKLEIPGRQFPIQICYEPPERSCVGIKSLMRDYVDRTVEKVINICKIEAMKQPYEDIYWEDGLETRAAHILAFLSNPLETSIAEERLYSRLIELKHNVKVKIVTLYGNMSSEDRAEVFAPLESGYHHKVIFATNVGETSITIPGVRYVVDCGLAKVKKFDAMRRTDVLELDLISKSAAKQRAGRAGRTASGICYRLYSKEQYEEMEATNVPDILLTNLAEVVLYMVAAGIKDPAEFDFIDKPNAGLLLQSQTLLRSLKAIECVGNTPVLTKLGEEMKQLPVEPRLAKMVLDSVEYDLVAETAVVCAGIQVGSLFYRGRKENQFVLADQKKLAFCEETGDPMTALSVFWQYINTPKVRLRHWCRENYVNSKCMKTVYDIAYKICKMISNLRYVDANVRKIDVAKAREHIPDLFCRSFGSNLAIYSGLPQRGYYDFNAEKYVFIHPSSALKYNNITPEFIVYECAIQTSHEFVINVCAANSVWLNGLDQNVLEEKRKGKLVPYNITCGTAVKKWIISHMDSLRQEVGMECIWKRRFDDPYRRLQVYIAARNLPKLESFVQQTVGEKIEVICKKTNEVPIMHADYVLHMSGSGMPLEILMPGEFCSMFVGKEGINWETNTTYRKQLEEYFSKFGKITEFVTFGEELQKKIGHSCLVRMESKEVAFRAYKNNDENQCGFDIEPRLGRRHLGRVGSYRPCAYRLLIKWWRRPSCGFGQVKLKCRNFQLRMHAFDVISKYLGNFQPSVLSEDLMDRDSSINVDDLYKIRLQSLPLNVDNRGLYKIVEPVLDRFDIEIDEVYVVRKKAYPIEDDITIQEYSRRISEHIIRVAKDADITLRPLLNNMELRELDNNAYPFEVKVRTPKHDYDIAFVAFVLFSDMNLGMRVGNALKEAAKNGINLEMGPLNRMHEADIKQMFHYQMEVPVFLFKAIFDDLKDIYSRIDHESIDFDYRHDSYRNICHLYVAGEDFNDVNEVKAAIDKVIDGYTISCRDGEEVDGVNLPCHRLLTKVGRNFLRDLSRRFAIFLSTSPYKMEVTIQGSLLNVEKAKMEIKRYLHEWSSADVRQVLVLQPPDYRPGTLKALLAQNNYDLCVLEKQFGHGVHLDAKITRSELLFAGKENEFQKLLAMLRSISDSIKPKDCTEEDMKENEIPECAICLCTATPECYCLEACGHYACKMCLNMQLKTSIETRDFPIVCVACEKPFTWFDLEVLILGDYNRDKSDDPKRLQLLADASLAYFVDCHGDLYKHCLTPDCRGLHPVTKKASVGRCRLCDRVQCTRCGKEEHESMTCEEYAKLRVNADESLRKWMKEDQNKRRICPNSNCQAVIEKFGGCNHMQCTRCKLHFCWVCMFTARESKDIYAHMETEHGGSGADAHELMEEMQNDPLIREFVERHHPELLLDRGFNLGEDGAIWVMPDEDANDEEHLIMMDDEHEVHNFFEFQQDLNGLQDDEINVPDMEFEFRNDYGEVEGEGEDADIV